MCRYGRRPLKVGGQHAPVQGGHYAPAQRGHYDPESPRKCLGLVFIQSQFYMLTGDGGVFVCLLEYQREIKWLECKYSLSAFSSQHR